MVLGPFITGDVFVDYLIFTKLELYLIICAGTQLCAIMFHFLNKF